MFRYYLILFVFIFMPSIASAVDFGNTNLSPGALVYSEQPYVYKENEVLIVHFESESDVLRALVPEPLIPNEDNVIRIYVAKYKIPEPYNFHYMEASLVIPVTYMNDENEIKKGDYFPVMYLNEVSPIIGGREIYGFPKISADIDFTRNETSAHGVVKVYGETIIDLSFDISNKVKDIAKIGSWNGFTYKRIPAANLDEEYIVKQLITYETSDHDIYEQYLGEANLKLSSTYFNPLGSIPIVKVLSASLNFDNFTINEGHVLHDYLNN